MGKWAFSAISSCVGRYPFNEGAVQPLMLQLSAAKQQRTFQLQWQPTCKARQMYRESLMRHLHHLPKLPAPQCLI